MSHYGVFSEAPVQAWDQSPVLHLILRLRTIDDWGTTANAQPVRARFLMGEGPSTASRSELREIGELGGKDCLAASLANHQMLSKDQCIVLLRHLQQLPLGASRTIT